jgi:L-alanine-DL-glutamate epimerase-like enolase superfamily enzyme
MEQECERARALLKTCAALSDTNSVLPVLELLEGQKILAPVRSGIDQALHDRWGKKMKQPLYQLWDFAHKPLPNTCLSIGMDEPDKMAETARTSGFTAFKLKLGRQNDVEMVRAVREAVPSAQLRLDPNAGWTREEAVQKLAQLEELKIEFVEQPLAPKDTEGWRWLKSRSSIPLFADESIQSSEDLVTLAPHIDGMVLKIMKPGGLYRSKQMLEKCRALGLKSMMSCMVESSLGVTAAAHLAPLADYADLDGPLLISNDPWQGISYGPRGELTLSKRNGLGVVAR